MNESDAMDLLAEIIVNYGNLKTDYNGFIKDENWDKWQDTLFKYYLAVGKK